MWDILISKSFSTEISASSSCKKVTPRLVHKIRGNLGLGLHEALSHSCPYSSSAHSPAPILAMPMGTFLAPAQSWLRGQCMPRTTAKMSLSWGGGGRAHSYLPCALHPWPQGYQMDPDSSVQKDRQSLRAQGLQGEKMLSHTMGCSNYTNLTCRFPGETQFK